MASQQELAKYKNAQSKSGLSNEIVAFANSARIAQALLNDDNAIPMAIKEFKFTVDYEFGETRKENLEMAFNYWAVSGKGKLSLDTNRSSKLNISCTLVPIITFNNMSGSSGDDSSE